MRDRGSNHSVQTRKFIESPPYAMGKLKNYDCHKQKYYVPQNKPAWSLLNLKQAAKKVEKEKSSAKKQVLGKKKKIAEKLKNRKGGQGVRNPANPEFKNILQKVRRGFGVMGLGPRVPRHTTSPSRLLSPTPPPFFDTLAATPFPPPPLFRVYACLRETFYLEDMLLVLRRLRALLKRTSERALSPRHARSHWQLLLSSSCGYSGEESEAEQAHRKNQRPPKLEEYFFSPAHFRLARADTDAEQTKMPPSIKTSAAATALAPAAGTSVNKKRAAAAIDASAPVLGADDPEAARFASRVALHLREAALASGAAWDDARVRGAFEETVTNMPEGALRATLARNLAHFSEMIVEKTTRPVPADLPQLGELGGLDHEEFFALRERPRFDFDEMTLGELVHETRRCMLRATFDLPCWLADERDERDELEAVREQSLERCADAAAAMVGRFADEVAAAVGAGGTGKSGRGKGVEVPSAAVIEEVSETLARAQAYAALRRHSGGEDWSRERTHRAAARFPILRQALRRALSRDTKPARDKRATAGHDAAICCGHTRYFLVVALAKEVPDDVEVFASAVDGDAEGETDHAGGLHGKVKKKKSKRGVVGMFGVADLPLFEAALGLAGFDEDFEAKVRATTCIL